MGEKTAHQFLIMARNSNIPQGSVLFAAKEGPLMVKSGQKKKKPKVTHSTSVY